MNSNGQVETVLHHPFVRHPHRTLLTLSLPVLVSLVAEPLTGLVDTAFVAQLGAAPLAALGVGSAALSAVFWIFNFLGIGSQTDVAQALGAGDPQRAARSMGLGLLLAALFGFGSIVMGGVLAAPLARGLGAEGEVLTYAESYMLVRLLGAPAVIASLVAFGVLRGLQDMRTPLWVAVAVNALNIVLDWLLIFGAGPIPAMGVTGAAAASTAAQWFGAIWVSLVVVRRLGWPSHLQVHEARALLRVGGDLFLRTGFLTIFLLLATRAATNLGPESGAAHQAVRQFWIFAALGLDALAITAQSLVGYFLGAGWVTQARRVARLACLWSAAMGALLGMGMWLLRSSFATLLAPPETHSLFFSAWLLSAVVQPLNALAFATDGVHWGTGDFRYLRNAAFAAMGIGVIALLGLEATGPASLAWVWIVTGGWITVRAALGIVRIWPGIGRAPLSQPDRIQGTGIHGSGVDSSVQRRSPQPEPSPASQPTPMGGQPLSPHPPAHPPLNTGNNPGKERV
ncbi:MULTISPECIES: MATE family efflux transporter [Caldilinea]|uniref:Putative MatE family transporter n=1 Tax=Caldilinea aerophila (strain DSM 14535 / JCM 11387 / NBRC 104270 / STL-6-O1) TaxID=926550 RepID=I0I4V8_CALAS|nr:MULTISPECIES: MATE family efflux transporter [Caldilinea]MBO9393845.1 MATE family efflux transporter [Caldilinea sp.]BAM00296.1 putative MatE family transporter [Caldilinea aerophila DSM 14535 = NBRC 104270]GIV71655.1 MAG: MATE family efflux transporter [Caldilinea sp.]